MKAAALYFRVSTEDQRDRQTIETQAGEVRRYCLREQVPVYDTYADDGISGTVPFDQRPGGARLLRDAGAGHFDTVLVYKLDRLGRDPLVTMLAVEKLKAAGVSVTSTTQSFDADDPTGRLLMTILSGVAGFERETIIQRSIAGSNRLAREGVWLGGIVPYGYRVEGSRAAARLVIDEAPLAGRSLSKAGVVRWIYSMAGGERLSCQHIADRLNQAEIPTAYAADGRELKRGKRLGATVGIWRPHQVRNLLTNTTYKGTHAYGKDSKSAREVIERPVPALVSEAEWEQARLCLKANAHAWSAAAKAPRRAYLLRGLITCGACGKNYCGATGSRAKLPYYLCSGQSNARGLYGPAGGRCHSKALRAEALEAEVWQDIEGFLRDPGALLEELAAQLAGEALSAGERQQETEQLARKLAAKESEADTVIGLFRRGRIDPAQLDRQLDAIAREERDLKAQLDASRRQVLAAAETEQHLRSAEARLRELHHALDQPLTDALKRQLVEDLVSGIKVETVGTGRAREAVVHVTYVFRSDNKQQGTPCCLLRYHAARPPAS